jgi:cardiolipin synthase
MWVEHLLVDLRREGYRPVAWVAYLRRAFAYGRERALANPAAVRSILFVGLVLFLGSVAGSAILALAVDAGLGRRVFGWTAVGLVPLVSLTLLHVELLRDRTGTPLDALGWPSALTLSRVAMVPAFLVFMAAGRARLALVVFLFAILSDLLDGWVARSFHQETRFGAILDPLADILCSFWLFVGMWLGGLLPWTALALAAARTVVLLGGGSLLYVTLGPVHIHSTVPGKMTGLLLTGLVAARLAIAAFDLGGLERPLTPIVVDALVVLLGFTVLYGVAIGWINLRRLRTRHGAERVITDVRFGA